MRSKLREKGRRRSLRRGRNVILPGQYYDAESSLYYNMNRYYDPTLGRYIQSDPIGLASGLNTYLYAGANPILMIDPMGLSFGSAAGCFVKGAAVGAVGAVVVGVVAVGAVTIGAPVAVVTAALGGLAIVGGVVTGANIGLGVANGNWDSVAYNAGAAVGGFAAGGVGGRAIAEGVNGVPSPPWSLGSDAAQGYNSSLGSIGQWLGTGPNPGSAAATAGAAGAGAASASGCGCGS